MKELKIKRFEERKRSIEWLSSAAQNGIESLITSNLASVRLRTAVAIESIQKSGLTCTVSDGFESNFTDMVIVGKIDAVTDTNRPERWIKRLEISKRLGSHIVVDYTDHHIGRGTAASMFYAKALTLADTVICSSQKLREHISQYSKIETILIEDPIEVPILPPTEPSNELPTILWFGHASNLPYLVDCLRNNFSEESNARIILMTNVIPLPDNYASMLDIPQLANMEIYAIPWTKNDLIEISSIIDFCIIPAGVNDSVKNGASSNRLLTSLALGLPTIADSLESYKPFSKYFLDFDKETIRQMLKKPKRNLKLITEAQSIIAKDYTSEKIGSQWKNMTENIFSRSSFSQTKTPEISDVDMSENHSASKNSQLHVETHAVKYESSTIRLNLGCGDKILPGYINVDVVESRAGKKPDVICDLHHLSEFPSDFADEILAVHVIEHFWQWEVIDILKEWARVLKPGGKMILECPNLISAAEEFLKNPDIAALGGQQGQRSMWVFYGDPGWRDPLMIHRWGYTPRSLAAIMNEAGLTELKQEPAQFKLREPRDMRITATKPKNFSKR
jgi:SAM-dependent methyltransferase